MSIPEDVANLFIPAIQQYQHLTYLRMTNLMSPSVTQTLLKSTHCWPHLKTLHVGNCNRIDDTIWLPFMKTHPALCDVQLNEAMLTDASLDAIPVYLPSLTHLVLWVAIYITSEGIRRLIRRRHQLKQQQQHRCSLPPPWTAIELFDCPLVRPNDFPNAVDNFFSSVHLDPEAINKIIEQTPLE